MINVGVFLSVALAVNLLASFYWDARYLWKKIFIPINEKAYTQSLPDQEQAQRIYREKKQLDTRYVPYIAWAKKPFQGETTTVNAEGDRTHPLMTESPIQHVRFFGGSTMWGSGVDDHNTIPAHFNALFQDSRAYNHGESGFVSRQGVARLVNLVNQEAPMDAVIFYDGCNDCLSLCRVDVSINGHREEAKIAQKLDHQWEIVNTLFGSTKLIIEKIVKKGKRPPSRCRNNPAYAKKVAATLVNNWKIAQSLAALSGAEFHAILQPVAPLGHPNIEYLEERGTETDFHSIYPLVLEIKAKEHLDWIHDFTDAFDVDEYIYIDSCHVNGRGNQIIAQKISELLHRQPSR